MTYTLENIKVRSIADNPVKYSKVILGTKWRTHKLENDFTVRLTDGREIHFFKGFLWDRSSVPQFLWGILRPDGDDDIAYLIHDYLYSYKLGNRKFADKEMLRWAKEMKETRRWSLRNIDIHVRYHTVRLFGGFVWRK
jgi:hypothetical protein